MASLLESRALHHRIRVQSRKARESEVYNQEYLNRRLPNVEGTHDVKTEDVCVLNRSQFRR